MSLWYKNIFKNIILFRYNTLKLKNSSISNWQDIDRLVE